MSWHLEVPGGLFVVVALYVFVYFSIVDVSRQQTRFYKTDEGTERTCYAPKIENVSSVHLVAREGKILNH